MAENTKNEDVTAKNKWEKMAEEPVDLANDTVEQASIDGDDEVQNVDQSGHEDLDAPEDGVEQADIEAGSNSALQDQIEALKLKLATYQDQTARAVAEMDNMRRRTERDVSQARLFANERLIKELLPVIDSLVRAQEGVDDTDPKAKAMLEGVTLTADLLEKTLSNAGLEVINPDVGTVFNPDIHEAMSMVPNPDANKNEILQVLQKGYQLNSRVIRAAMVIVAS